MDRDHPLRHYDQLGAGCVGAVWTVMVMSVRPCAATDCVDAAAQGEGSR